jgi:hypothetical protein
MSLAGIAMRSARPGVMALLLVAAVEVAAQQAPPHVLVLSSPSAIRAMNLEREMDLEALDAFGGKGRADALRPLEQPPTWTLYGGFGVVNFRNQLEPDSSGVHFSWRRTGPRLGKISVGLYRRF